VLAEKRVAAAVAVANGSTLLEAEVTAPTLIVLKFRTLPAKEAAVGKVTTIAEAELKMTYVSVTATA
jgi:hypothetical protein